MLSNYLFQRVAQREGDSCVAGVVTYLSAIQILYL